MSNLNIYRIIDNKTETVLFTGNLEECLIFLESDNKILDFGSDNLFLEPIEIEML